MQKAENLLFQKNKHTLVKEEYDQLPISQNKLKFPVNFFSFQVRLLRIQNRSAAKSYTLLIDKY